jgi:ubiquitin-conjugating enzyme E2 G1
MASSSAAAGLLSRQLKQMQNDKDIPGISCGLFENNVFEWEVMLMINDDTKFYGGAWGLLERQRFVADVLSYRWLL